MPMVSLLPSWIPGHDPDLACVRHAIGDQVHYAVAATNTICANGPARVGSAVGDNPDAPDSFRR